MCGIIGYLGAKPAVPVLIHGLRRLEYRGYDSAGIALVRGGEIEVRRSAGKLDALEQAIRDDPVDGEYGVGHTRWATHGRPTEENAHPHRDCSGRLVVVHNGIIENHVELKRRLQQAGHRFRTETDTEVIAHLVEQAFEAQAAEAQAAEAQAAEAQASGAGGAPDADDASGAGGAPGGDGLEGAVRRVLPELRGSFGMVFAHAADPQKLVAVRNGPPLVVGTGEREFLVASDAPAVLDHTRDVVFLGDEEMAVVTRRGVDFQDFAGRPIAKTAQRILWDPVTAEKAGYKHFMLKEIFEQPRALQETIIGRLSAEHASVHLGELDLPDDDLRAIDQVTMLACGTSWHAALVGKFLIEGLARLRVEVDYGSEFRDRAPLVGPRTLAVALTQSGETADTLAALREARARQARSIAICNVVGSTASREADGTVYTHAGPEIGVASTKAFTAQLVALNLLALRIGQARGAVAEDDARRLIEALTHLPVLVEQTLRLEPRILKAARRFYRAANVLYLGRGIHYPIALEGALKLKEISYIHAEGYPAGEMKHGPIALIDENLPVVAVMPCDRVFAKMRSNVKEAKSRGAALIVLTDAAPDALDDLLDEGDCVIPVPSAHSAVMPVLMAAPLQLLAYHIGVLRGCDVDQPRNLAKSVTVE